MWHASKGIKANLGASGIWGRRGIEVMWWLWMRVKGGLFIFNNAQEEASFAYVRWAPLIVAIVT